MPSTVLSTTQMLPISSNMLLLLRDSDSPTKRLLQLSESLLRTGDSLICPPISWRGWGEEGRYPTVCTGSFVLLGWKWLLFHLQGASPLEMFPSHWSHFRHWGPLATLLFHPPPTPQFSLSEGLPGKHSIWQVSVMWTSSFQKSSIKFLSLEPSFSLHSSLLANTFRIIRCPELYRFYHFPGFASRSCLLGRRGSWDRPSASHGCLCPTIYLGLFTPFCWSPDLPSPLNFHTSQIFSPRPPGMHTHTCKFIIT